MIAHLLIYFLALSNAYGFGFFPGTSVNPNLQKLAEAQKGTLLNLRLILGDKNQGQMGLDNLQIELIHEKPDYKHALMPGKKRPNDSSGVYALRVVKNPSFIGMNGSEQVTLLNGCWELVWDHRAPAGSIVCSFDVPKEARRNDASGAFLPSGNIYICLPVMTKDSLKGYTQRAAEKGGEFIKAKEEELVKMESTNNPIMKALHYRKAFEATVNYKLSGAEQVASVVSDTMLDDVIHIEDGLRLIKDKGTISTIIGDKTMVMGSATASSGYHP